MTTNSLSLIVHDAAHLISCALKERSIDAKLDESEDSTGWEFSTAPRDSKLTLRGFTVPWNPDNPAMTPAIKSGINTLAELINADARSGSIIVREIRNPQGCASWNRVTSRSAGLSLMAKVTQENSKDILAFDILYRPQE